VKALNGNREDPKLLNKKHKQARESCPHCGTDLSPWQQVLLAVDHVLVCRRCWYTIILDVHEDQKQIEDGPVARTKD
jgi:hypothetical protein